MELVSEAIAFAVKAHDGMRRKKSSAPYILHPREASVIVGTMTDDQNLIARHEITFERVEQAGVCTGIEVQVNRAVVSLTHSQIANGRTAHGRNTAGDAGLGGFV